MRDPPHHDRLRHHHEEQGWLRQGHVDLLRDERRRPGPLRVHAHELAERLYRRGGRLHHPHPHRLQDYRYPRYGGRLRHLPAPLPHLHRRDHHLRLRGPV